MSNGPVKIYLNREFTNHLPDNKSKFLVIWVMGGAESTEQTLPLALPPMRKNDFYA
jgi:hypothetical protein